MNLLVLLILIVLENCTGIIRNDITDRCLYMRTHGKPRNSKKLTIYARACSWDLPEQNTRSHPNEHLEIVASEISEAANLKYVVRKVEQLAKNRTATSSSTCLSSTGNRPGITSACMKWNPDSEFKMEVVPQQNFIGSLTSRVSFKIRNSAGYCLTVQPGQEILQFKECSSKYGLFQVWQVCRHNRHCDVDLKWTSRNIHFPYNETNSTLPGIIKQPDSTLKPPIHILPTSASTERAVKTEEHITPPKCSLTVGTTGVVNEVLYTIQNALKIYESSEEFLASSLNAFYPGEVLAEAASLVQDICSSKRLECSLCKLDIPTCTTGTIADLLLRWMTECNVGASRQEFLSNNVLHVLLPLFPIQDSLLRTLPADSERLRLIIPSLRNFLNGLEKKLSINGDESLESKVKTHQEQEIENGVTGSTSDTNEAFHVDDSFPHFLDIDIRFGNTKRNSSSEKSST